MVSKFREVTYTGAAYERERRWFVSKRPRRDTNGGSENEVVWSDRDFRATYGKFPFQGNGRVYVVSEAALVVLFITIFAGD